MTDDAPLEPLLESAVRAPSSHNTQPWLFRPRPDGVDLLADRTRALPANDPADRELTISCGCALLNLRAAAAAEGAGTQVTLLPDGPEADRLAHVRLGGPPDAALAPLAAGIEGRRTHRARFADRPVTAAETDILRDEAAAEGAWLTPLTSAAAHGDAAALVAEGDAAQWADPAWRRELAQWMHPRRQGDGLSLPWLAVPVARMVVRTFDMGNGVAARDEALAEHSPLLAVLGTAGDTPADWLRAGQALERLLLAGVRAGLQASYLNQPVQVARLRPRLADLAGQPGHPQILLRLGHATDSLPAAPRRPLSDVTLAQGG
jgi:nitroreductase